MGTVEPMDLGDDADQSDGAVFEFTDNTTGNNLSKSYVPAISKGVGDVRQTFFLIILGPFSRGPQPRIAPHAPCGVFYFVPMLVGC